MRLLASNSDFTKRTEVSVVANENRYHESCGRSNKFKRTYNFRSIMIIMTTPIPISNPAVIPKV